MRVSDAQAVYNLIADWQNALPLLVDISGYKACKDCASLGVHLAHPVHQHVYIPLPGCAI